MMSVSVRFFLQNKKVGISSTFASFNFFFSFSLSCFSFCFSRSAFRFAIRFIVSLLTETLYAFSGALISTEALAD